MNTTHTGCGKGGVEPDISVVMPAISLADAGIAARDKVAGSTHTELCKQLAQSLCVFMQDTRLLSTVPQADCLQDPRLLGHVVEPLGVLRQSQSVMGTEICLLADSVPVVAVDRLDNGSRACCQRRCEIVHELYQIQYTWDLPFVAHNPNIIVRHDGKIGVRPVQPTQNRRMDVSFVRLAARQHIHRSSRRSIHRSTGAAAWRLLRPQKAHGREGRRRCNGLHVYVQCRGEFIANCSENCFIRPGMVVELVL
jgi:hypothetical protein